MDKRSMDSTENGKKATTNA